MYLEDKSDESVGAQLGMAHITKEALVILWRREKERGKRGKRGKDEAQEKRGKKKWVVTSFQLVSS